LAKPFTPRRRTRALTPPSEFYRNTRAMIDALDALSAATVAEVLGSDGAAPAHLNSDPRTRDAPHEPKPRFKTNVVETQELATAAVHDGHPHYHQSFDAQGIWRVRRLETAVRGVLRHLQNTSSGRAADIDVLLDLMADN
jgi:hypothetical protein